MPGLTNDKPNAAIPIIDIGAGVEPAVAAKAMIEAGEQYGFLYIKGHGLEFSDEDVNRAFASVSLTFLVPCCRCALHGVALCRITILTVPLDHASRRSSSLLRKKTKPSVPLDQMYDIIDLYSPGRRCRPNVLDRIKDGLLCMQRHWIPRISG